MAEARTTCKTCELTERRRLGVAPLWDCIHSGTYWDVAHAFNTAMPGWLVVVLQRHAEALDELSEPEATELGLLIRRVSVALRAATGCQKTYVVQFAEHPDHPHVHFHVVPRMADQPEERLSTGVFSYLGVPDEESVDVNTMNEIARQVQGFLSA